MFLFSITAFFIFILYIAWRFKISMVEAAPVGSALLILGLYPLAFFRMLSFSDYLSAAVTGLCVFCFVRLTPGRQKELIGFVKREIVSPATLTALVMTAVMAIGVSGKAVSWWDDYNFWATDAKALFFLDGFAKKYTNVAAEFGDYPPGTQLMKWWFLHFWPGEFREGLMFAGYYFLNLSFLFPLLKPLNGGEAGLETSGKGGQSERKNVRKRLSQMAAAAAVLWLFPSVAEAFWYDGCCADLTMALVYGAFLTAVIDHKGRGRFFYYGRQALFLMVLVLCKNTGFLWSAFGLLFDYGYHFFFLRSGKGAGTGSGTAAETGGKSGGGKGFFAPLALVTLLPVLTELSWLGFCVWNRRVAKLTGAAIQMATGGMNIPAYQSGMVKAFAEAFLSWPLHRGRTFAIDLSPLGLFLILLVFVGLLWKLGLLERRKAVYLGGFLAAVGVVFYSINLISHLTIFAVETQYLEPFGMVSSIERYGAPFTIGGLYLLAFLAAGKGVDGARKSGTGALLCMVFVLLTADYAGAYRALWGYRSTVEEVLREREEIIDEKADSFLAALQEEETAAGSPGRKKGKCFQGRVLYLRDSSDVSWVRNTYVGFAASPVSVMYGNIDTATADFQTIQDAIREAHAGFLYVDELEEESPEAEKELFAPFLEGEEFSYGCLYQVKETEDGIRLVK